MLTSIIAAVVILGLLILIHEAGHFFMAKKLGVRVLRFSIGYPPRILGIRRGETEYVIGATPFGGYVRMLGDEVAEEPKADELQTTFLTEVARDLVDDARVHGALGIESDTDVALLALANRLNAFSATGIIGRDLKPEEYLLLNRIRLTGSCAEARKSLGANPPDELLAAFRARAFPTQRLWKRIAIVLAGPLANVVFAPILLTIVFMYGVPSLLPVVGQLSPGLPAEQAGLRSGDRIFEVNGHPTATWVDFSDIVKSGNGSPVTLRIERTDDGRTTRQTVTIKPRQSDEKTIYGTTAKQWIIGVKGRGDEIVTRFNPLTAAYRATEASVSMTGQLAVGIASIVTGATPVREALGGPIMIAQMAGKQAHQGFASIAMF